MPEEKNVQPVAAQEEKPARRRIHLMDEARGFAVFCMIFYHAFYTMAFMYGLPWGETLLFFFKPAEPFFAALFIFISGISSDLSHSNLVRGLKLLGVALGVTLVTAVVVPDEIIVFGVLHMLAVCMILFGLAKPFFQKLPVWPSLAVLSFLLLLTWNLSNGFLGIPPFSVTVPQSLTSIKELYPFGFTDGTLFSADYFPLLPWLFVFLGGTFLGRFAAAGQFPAFTYKSRVPFFSWMGRHALILYIVHQPVIYGVLWLITQIFHI